MGEKSAVLCGYSGDAASSLEEALRPRGFGVKAAKRLDWLLAKGAHVIFCSISDDISEKDYRILLEEIQVARLARKGIPIICTSEGENIGRVVEVIRSGATDYEKWAGGSPAPERLLDLADSASEGLQRHRPIDSVAADGSERPHGGQKQ